MENTIENLYLLMMRAEQEREQRNMEFIEDRQYLCEFGYLLLGFRLKNIQFAILDQKVFNAIPSK